MGAYMERQHGDTGESVFVRFEPSLTRIRTACGKAIRAHKRPQRFVVVYKNLYYGSLLSAMLAHESELFALLQALHPGIDSETEGAWNCAALLQEDTNDGLLLHGNENQLWCAYLPLRTRAQVIEAHEVAERLSSLAQNAAGIWLPIEAQTVPAGTYNLKDILMSIAERIDA